MNVVKTTAAVVAAVLCAGLLSSCGGSAPASDPAPAAPAPKAKTGVVREIPDGIDREKVSTSTISKIDTTAAAGYVFGQESAPLTVIEYASPDCSDCAITALQANSAIKQFVDEGKVKFVFKPLSLGKFVNDPAIIARWQPQSIEDITAFYKNFASTSKWEEADVKQHLGAEEKPEAKAIAEKITAEAGVREIKKVPTVFVGSSAATDDYYRFTEVDFTAQQIQDLFESMLINLGAK